MKQDALIGLCMKAGLYCPGCESFVPINALVSSVRCSGCGNSLELTVDNWKSLLEDPLKEVSSLEEDQGSRSNIFSSYNFKRIAGRQAPRYAGTGDRIDTEVLLNAIENGEVHHPATGEATGIRRLPEAYAKHFVGVVALVGEDPSQLPGKGGDDPIESDISGPIALQCPNCGGSLIIDGTERELDCGFCDSSVSIPDDLWFRLHPVQKMKRWYILIDEMRQPVVWEDDVWDAVRDNEGNFYFTFETDHSEPPVLISTGKDRSLRWKRSMKELEHDTSRGEPRLSLTSGGKLLAATSDRTALHVLSTGDGSTINTLEPPEGAAEESSMHFSMKGCYDFGVFPDDTLFLYRDCGRRQNNQYVMEFQRFDLVGGKLPLWDTEESSKPGFLQRLKRFFLAVKKARYFDHTRDYPVATMEFDIRISVSADGSVYMLEHNNLLVLEPDGRKRFQIELPCNYTTGRPAVNSRGEAFAVARQDNDIIHILKVSPDGETVSINAKKNNKDRQIEKNEVLTISPDGKLSLMGYNGYWISIDPEGD